MLQIGAALFYDNLRQRLLQIGTASLLQNWGKCYYKLGQVLQIRAIIINWSITLTTGDFEKGDVLSEY